MTIQECKDNIFDYAKKKGFDDCELYYTKKKEFDVTSFNQEIDSFSSSETQGLSFRGLYKGKMGYSYAEILDDTSIKMLVEQAIENAQSVDSDDKEFIHDGSGNYTELNEYVGDVEKIPVEDKLQYALDIEKKLKSKDKIIQANHCSYGEAIYEKQIYNTKGVSKSFKNDFAYLMGLGVASNNDENNKAPKTGFSFKIAKKKDNIDIDYVVEDIYKRSTSMLGAKSVKTGKYRIVLENRVLNSFMGVFSTIFSAESVQKGRSLLKGKIGQQIANPKLTISDDPHRSGSITSMNFDDEGVATYKKELVSKGILKTYLHNLKSATKDGVSSTGNAHRSSHKTSIGISPSNMVIEKGELSFDGLVEKCGDGIFITDVAGLHSGANPISGDFSLMASGFKIEGGKITHPVEQITISSNLFKLFNNIEEIGNDIIESPPSNGTFFSPSILISEINVAGSED